MFPKIKSFLFSFFHFNKQERNGMFVLFLILVILFSVKILLPYFVQSNSSIYLKTLDLKSNATDIDTHLDKEILEPKNSINSYHKTELFVFNPNSLSAEDASKLGFSKKLISTLFNFRSKGGRFFKPSDLKKIYGLSPKFYEMIEPYVLIPNFKNDTTSRHYTSFPKKNNVKTILELNSADSLLIVSLRGIGPSFAKRIIKYRTMLGGFHQINQLKEIYGMTDSLFICLSSQVNIDDKKIIQIPINTTDLNTLRKHPYFNFQSAQAIINYRTKHGKLIENDIVELGIFNSQKLSVILPYLTY